MCLLDVIRTCQEWCKTADNLAIQVLILPFYMYLACENLTSLNSPNVSDTQFLVDYYRVIHWLSVYNMVIIVFVFFRVWAERGAFSSDVWHNLGLNASYETVWNETNIYSKVLLG